MKYILIFFYFFQNILSLCAQEITLPEKLRSNSTPFEFSSLAIWENEKSIIVTPALKIINDRSGSKPKYIYSISFEEISKSIKNSGHEVLVNQIYFDAKSYSKFIESIPDYDGIEGTVIVGNDIYFSIECKNELCFLVKGTISQDDSKRLFITFSEKCSIKKRYPRKDKDRWDNDGFEGITYLQKEKRLLVVFERNYGKSRPKAYSVDLNLVEPKDYIFPDFSFNRLSDLTAIDGKFFFLNGIERGVKPQLIVLDSKQNLKTLEANLDQEMNWEGIVPFNYGDLKGFIFISDNCNCPNGRIYQTKLAFFNYNY